MGRAQPWSMMVLAGLLTAVFLASAVTAAEPEKAPKRIVSPRSDPAFPLRQADFPAASRMAGHDGIVSLLVLVDVDGSVVDQRVAATSGYPELDASALQVTKIWKLRPGTVNGVATKMWGFFAITFTVEGKPEPTSTEQHHAAAKLWAQFQEKMEAAAASSAATQNEARDEQ